MEVGTAPLVVNSSRRIRYRRSAWRVRQWVVGGAGGAWRGVTLRLRDSLLVWVGGAEPLLAEVALGVPGAASALVGGGGGGGGGAGGAALALARRLAAAARRPVYVCCGAAVDRFDAPLVERALIAQIKSFTDNATGLGLCD